jgi:hypothetical protein
MPSEKFTDRQGKEGYRKIIEFTDRAALDAFRDACLDAIDGVRAPSSESSPESRTAAAPNPWDARPADEFDAGALPGERGAGPEISDEDIPF